MRGLLLCWVCLPPSLTWRSCKTSDPGSIRARLMLAPYSLGDSAAVDSPSQEWALQGHHHPQRLQGGQQPCALLTALAPGPRMVPEQTMDGTLKQTLFATQEPLSPGKASPPPRRSALDSPELLWGLSTVSSFDRDAPHPTPCKGTPSLAAPSPTLPRPWPPSQMARNPPSSLWRAPLSLLVF